ncbi:MAG TPA: hypothetical protein VLA16_03130, partial [Ideonella sp.]|nr:hypothetical protein [Ideonella sp.]
MIFQKLKLKPPPPPIPSAQAGAERATRLVVERVEQMTVVGWAAANGRGAEVELLLHGSVVPAHVERGPRHDVAAALGLPAEEAYGFRVELPPGSWSNADATPAAFQVRCGNELSPVPLEHSFGALLQEWALHLQAMPAGGERERQLYALMAQVAHNGGMGQLANDQQAWLRAQARERQAEAALSDVSWTPPAARQLHGAIERFDGLTLQGWAMGSENAHEQLQLLCNGQTVPCSVVRLERRDVQQALETTRLQLGFEIELPSAIWALADSSGACVLQVQADFLPLSDPLRV